jgi:gliding motility-associated-like protein
MRKILLITFILFFIKPLFAKHVTGGEVVYDYRSSSSGISKNYTVTLRLFRDNFCTGCAAMPASVSLGIFDNDNNTRFGNYQTVSLASTDPLSIIASPPCLTNPPIFDYSVGYYNLDIELPNNARGYTIVYQTCCRVDGIENIGLSPSAGSSFIGTIPGSNTLPTGTDNSPRFETGISIICQNKRFNLNFSATDSNGDSLVYSFANAYDGGAASNASFSTPAAPPYGSVPYSSPFSGGNPLGPLAVINPLTGIISGIAPSAGKYIVCVVVFSYRNGNIIGGHRKDFIVTVAPCDFGGADLTPSVFYNCDGFTLSFKNVNTSILNTTFDWDFGEPASGANNTSTLEFPSHTYLIAGDYTIKLVVNRNTPCADSTTALVRVWPGFTPAFAPIPPQCKNVPVQFTDLTTTSFPPVTFWRWDFGVTTLTSDTSRLQNPTYVYTNAGIYNAEFIVETIKGCRDTLYPIVTIVDKPEFFITNDTLICTVDTLQLRSNVNSGTITWRPNYMISNVNSFNPLVSPDVTTTYIANYQDAFNCPAADTIIVTVVTDVSLLASNDTTICRTDTATLFLKTDALYFAWTPTNLMVNSTVQNPLIFPTDPINTFRVKASISNKCFKEKDIIVKTAPYPQAIVTGDNPICYGKSSQLNASGGSRYLWTPIAYLNNSNIANPISVVPKQTLTYTVQVNDTLGCPKPAFNSFTVNVVRIVADAGPSDTSVVLDQPLQLQATGSTNYLWTPNTWLDKDNLYNPISLPQNNIKYTVTVTNNIGCFATDTINVKVFFVPPGLYVPSAFSPTGDGNNELFRPVALGIKYLENFSIFSRWGLLLYSTNKIGAGWDGTYKGAKQNPGTYVWQASAVDYKNQKVFKKGTVILIR